MIDDMALEGFGRLFRFESYRNMIYVSAKVAGDSAFPFKPNERLFIRIDREHNRLLIERASAEKEGGKVRAARKGRAS